MKNVEGDIDLYRWGLGEQSSTVTRSRGFTFLA